MLLSTRLSAGDGVTVELALVWGVSLCVYTVYTCMVYIIQLLSDVAYVVRRVTLTDVSFFFFHWCVCVCERERERERGTF